MNAARNQDPRVAAATPGGGASEGGVAIRVRGLRKRYGDVEAVREIDLTVRTGETFAFLGPNGAGKTTTVETLEGYRCRDAGEAEVLGSDPARPAAGWRARIGVVLQESQPEAELTVEECVSLYVGYYPRPRPVGETLELVGLADRRAARCGQLRRRNCSGNASSTQENAHKTPAALTAKTPRFGLQITSGYLRCPRQGRITQR